MRIFLTLASIAFGLFCLSAEAYGQLFGQNGDYDSGEIENNSPPGIPQINLLPTNDGVKIDPEKEKAEKARKLAEKEQELKNIIREKLADLIPTLNNQKLALFENKGCKHVFKPGAIKTTSPGEIIRIKGQIEVLQPHDGGVIAKIGNTWVWIEGTEQTGFASLLTLPFAAGSKKKVLPVDALVVRGEPDSKRLMIRLSYGELHFIKLYSVAKRISPEEQATLLQLVENERNKRTAMKAQMALNEMRTWKDVSGKFSTRATFIKLADGKAVLKKKDGKTIAIPLEKLSDRDRDLIEIL